MNYRIQTRIMDKLLPFPVHSYPFLVEIVQLPTATASRFCCQLKSNSNCTEIQTTSCIEDCLPSTSSSSAIVAAPEQPGGKMVVELVGAFNELTDRMKLDPLLSTSSFRLLFKSLKLAIPLLQALPISSDGRSPLTKALSVAVILADLQMDAEVISAGVLRHIVEAGAMSLYEIRDRIGLSTSHLLHESLRVKKISSKVELLDDNDNDDDDYATALRKYCLTYYDARALVLELALKLDTMRHLNYLPRYQQQVIAIEVMKIHAPLAHALATNLLSLELEDLSFRYLFPYSYLCVDTWLRSQSKSPIDDLKDKLLKSLKSDPLLNEMVDNIYVKGRYKSRYSTMKKLLKDGRKPDEVNDILGLRVVLNPVAGDLSEDFGVKACYRSREIIQTMWREIPTRSKDYIARPKANGYKSLHMAVEITSEGGGRTRRPHMEVQIRTTEMDNWADDGTASHALYKSGLTDPEEAKRIKEIMIAAAELAALRLKDPPPSTSSNYRSLLGIDHRDRVFHLLDKNGDGKISIEELMEIMEELGAQGDDAREMMQLLDLNSDGSLSTDEFHLFQKQVAFMRNFEERDDEMKTLLDDKLQM